MKRLGFLATVAFVMAGGIGLLTAADAAEQKGLEKFQGKWALVSGTVDGKDLDADELKNNFMVVKGARAVFLFKDKERGTATMKIDAGKKPAQYDITYEDGPAKGTTLKGIYKIDGDTLTMCSGGIGKDRPTEFASKAGSGTVLVVSKRVKDEAKK
jgi:uncharacterized protein (TIGR03067 family)